MAFRDNSKSELKRRLNAIDLVALKIHEELLGSPRNRRAFPKFANVVFGPFYERWAEYKPRALEQLETTRDSATWDGITDTIELYESEIGIMDSRWKKLRERAPDQSGKTESVKKTKKRVKVEEKKAAAMSEGTKKGAIAAGVAVGVLVLLGLTKR